MNKNQDDIPTVNLSSADLNPLEKISPLQNIARRALKLSEQYESGDSNSNLYRELSEIDERYLRELQIGEGGMKRVLRVRDLATGRDLAMAVLPQLVDDCQIESFLHEARLTAQLQHSSIIPVNDIGIDGEGRPFFTMKLIEGRDLNHILIDLEKSDQKSQRDYPIEARLDIFVKICDAMSYAHSKGVIHLDIKAENIRISDYGEALICDWGLAQVIEELCEDPDILNLAISPLNPDSGQEKVISGTPGFMAPEVWMGSKEHKDHRSDVYSLGAVLYMMLTLEMPYEDGDLKHLRQACLDGKIIPPSERSFGKTIPRGLEAVCMKALATSPSERYQSVQEMIDDIHAYTRGFATRAEQAAPLTQLHLLLKRNRGIVFTSLAAILILIVSVGLFIVSLQKKEALARHNLELFEQASDEKQKLASTLALDHLRLSQQALAQLRLDSAFEQAKTAWALDNSNVEIQNQYCTTLLLEGEFQQAKKVAASDLLPAIDFALKCEQSSWDLGSSTAFLRVLPTSLHAAATSSILQRKLADIELRLALIRNLLDEHKTRVHWDESDSTLHFLGAPPRDLRFLALMPLRSISFAGCKLDALPQLPAQTYETIDLSETQITSLTSLKGLDLQRLILSGSKLKGLQGIADIRVLRLELNRCAPLSFARLLNHPSLKELVMDMKRLAPSTQRDLYKNFSVSSSSNADLLPKSAFDKLDRDEDDRISLKEFPFNERLFSAADKNSDAQIDWLEWRDLPRADLVTEAQGVAWVDISGNENLASFQVANAEVSCSQFVKFLNFSQQQKTLSITEESSPHQSSRRSFVLDSRSGLVLMVLDPDTRLAGGSPSRISFSQGKFSVAPAYQNLPVTHVTHYGALLCSQYYKATLPTRAQWSLLTSLCKLSKATPKKAQLHYNEKEKNLLFPLAASVQPEQGPGLYGIVGSLREWLLEAADDSIYKYYSAGSCFMNPPERSWAKPYPFYEGHADAFTGFRLVRKKP